ncbi:MAG: LytTR family DNA-binding domain-containing protein [Balneolaceae bacterium]
MINYLIIDDEYLAHDVIKGYCDLLPNMKLMKSCFDALEAIEYLSKNEVDLIFLDLNMPKLKGFEFLRTLANPPKVIVTTAYSEYALEGYELDVVDYLLKPFSFERLLKAVNKSISQKKDIPTSRSTSIKTDDGSPNTIFLKENKKYIQVNLDTIYFIEASGNYTKIITSGNTITTREKISELLTSLPDEDFIQVHKSFAVAKKYINSIEGNRIFIRNQVIPIGKMYKMNVNKLIN